LRNRNITSLEGARAEMTTVENQSDPKYELQSHAYEFLANGIPPPHVLLIGRDGERCITLGEEFASQMKVRFQHADAAKLAIQGDLTALLTQSGVVFLENLHLLKRALAEKLARALNSGEFEIEIGQGPATRIHKWDMQKVTVLASCSSHAECPSFLFRGFRCILQVGAYSQDALFRKLSEEAWKTHSITFEDEAAALLVRCCEGRADLLLRIFRRIVPHIPQIQTTNRPRICESEVGIALKKCRIMPVPLLSRTEQFDIHHLSGQEFELVIKSLLTKMGFRAELTEITGDGGIDIVATLDQPFCGGKFLFQCKRYSEGNLVGAPALRDFYGAVSAARSVNKGVFITTSDFTAQAREFAEQNNIEILNWVGLQDLFAKNDIRFS
jgi:hypothetical protein